MSELNAFPSFFSLLTSINHSRSVQSLKDKTKLEELPDIKIYYMEDFLGGPIVENTPSNAGDVGLIPGGGTKIPHVAGHPKNKRRRRQ